MSQLTGASLRGAENGGNLGRVKTGAVRCRRSLDDRRRGCSVTAVAALPGHYLLLVLPRTDLPPAKSPGSCDPRDLRHWQLKTPSDVALCVGVGFLCV